MHIAKKWILAALIGTSVIGGAAGATIAGVATSNAQTATPAVSSSSGGTSAPAAAPSNGGKFVPNEDPAHEANESAQREAQENAGQRPTVP